MNSLQAKKLEVIAALEEKRNEAIAKGSTKSIKRAYELTIWLNFVNRQASKPQIAALHYEYRQAENIQPSAQQQSLF